jgi:hypothetical protein
MSEDDFSIDLIANPQNMVTSLELLIKPVLELRDLVHLANQNPFFLQARMQLVLGLEDMIVDVKDTIEILKSENFFPIESPPLNYSNTFGFISSMSSNLYDIASSSLAFASQTYKEFNTIDIVAAFSEKACENLVSSIVCFKPCSLKDFSDDLLSKLSLTTCNVLTRFKVAEILSIDDKKLKSFAKIFASTALKENNKSLIENVVNASLVSSSSSLVKNYFSGFEKNDLAEILAYGMAGYMQDYSAKGFLSSAAKEALKINLRKVCNYNPQNITKNVEELGKIKFMGEVAELYSHLDKVSPMISVATLGSMVALNIYLAGQQDVAKSASDSIIITDARNAIDNNINNIIERGNITLSNAPKSFGNEGIIIGARNPIGNNINNVIKRGNMTRRGVSQYNGRV